jgi:hypothetical protein
MFHTVFSVFLCLNVMKRGASILTMTLVTEKFNYCQNFVAMVSDLDMYHASWGGGGGENTDNKNLLVCAGVGTSSTS